MSNAGSKVGIYTTENCWGGPQFKLVGPAYCGTYRDGTPSKRVHSWYRWQPTVASEVDGENPWRYWHECSMMGCDAKEYATDLPDLHDVLGLVAFLDQCGVPPNESLLDRVRNLCSQSAHDKESDTPQRHNPRIALDRPRIVGCTCGWRTPTGVTDSDDAFAKHVAVARLP